MKKARLILSASMIALMGISAVTFSSCSKDQDCAVGMTGKNCDQQIRTPMLGTYNANDTLDGGTQAGQYNPLIAADPNNITNVTIQNFGGLIVGTGSFFTGSSELVVSNVTESGDNISFQIPTQKPDGNYTVNGSGVYASKSNQITIQYSITDSLGHVNHFNGTWTKQ